jgi:hypothetical protein
VLDGGRGAIERFTPKLAIAAYHRDDDLVRLPREIAAIDAGYRFYLDIFSPVEDETVLFGAPTPTSSRRSSMYRGRRRFQLKRS